MDNLPKVYWLDNIYEIEEFPGGHNELRLGGYNRRLNQVVTDLPTLRKGNAEMHLWLESVPACKEYLICTKILEDGKMPRLYRTPQRLVDSKVNIKSALEQLVSKHTKKKRKDGWLADGEKPSDILKPMLLNRWDKYEKNIKYPCIAQIKKNGVCGTTNDDDFYSRKLEQLELLHLTLQLRQTVFNKIPLHGELCYEDATLEEIAGAVNRDNYHDAGKPLMKCLVEFHIFDRLDMPDKGYAVRYKSLMDLMARVPSTVDVLGTTIATQIHLVPCRVCQNYGELEAFYEEAIANGEEGVVVRNIDSKYLIDKRSKDCLKWKPVFSKEFKITDIIFDNDAKHGKLVKYVCRTEEGKVFKAVPSWPKARRAEVYQEYLEDSSNEVIGKMLTVEYREVTKKGAPRHAVAKVIREDI